MHAKGRVEKASYRDIWIAVYTVVEEDLVDLLVALLHVTPVAQAAHV